MASDDSGSRARRPVTTVLRLGDRPVAVELRGFELAVVEGPDKGQVGRPSGRALVVGTHPPSHLILSDPHVSRQHLRISAPPDSDAWVITDLGSTNGTRVGGVRVREALLEDGALIEIGATRLRFGAGSDTTRVELSSDDVFEGLLGRSLAMRELFALLERVAPSEVPVLIEGETGTGKEKIARALHARSKRAQKPFCVFDCAAVAPTLIEAELFGHERGAFTGATERRAGVFERAAGGTVFLDELGELALELQPKLLRVLESGEVQRIGGDKPIPIDVRVVAATNRDLRARIADGQFREDLYYRLAVVTLKVPPLRERRDDIPLLAAHFAKDRVADLGGTSGGGMGWETIFDFMKNHDWPGNVRELRNVVERAVIMADPALLQRDPLDALAELRKQAEPALRRRVSLRAARDQFEREYLEDLLRSTDGDLDEAAAVAELHRKSLERLLREHGIKRPTR